MMASRADFVVRFDTSEAGVIAADIYDKYGRLLKSSMSYELKDQTALEKWVLGYVDNLVNARNNKRGVHGLEESGGYFRLWR